MRKTKKSAHKPVKIEFTFLLREDGSILATYEGTDPRTHAVGKSVLTAIACEYDFAITKIA